MVCLGPPARGLGRRLHGRPHPGKGMQREEVEALRRRRDAARVAAVVGVMALMALGLGFRVILDVLAALFGNVGPLGGWVVAAFLAYTALALLLWMYWGLRLRRIDDPWAYDPEIDGPDPRVRRGLEQAAEDDSDGSGRTP